jgi:hypothetical protein
MDRSNDECTGPSNGSHGHVCCTEPDLADHGACSRVADQQLGNDWLPSRRCVRSNSRQVVTGSAGWGLFIAQLATLMLLYLRHVILYIIMLDLGHLDCLLRVSHAGA